MGDFVGLTRFGDIFGGDTPTFPLTPFQVSARAAAVYLIGLVIIRFGKSRLVSRATPLDVIVGFMLGSLLSRGITGHAALSTTAVATAVLVGMHWSLTSVSCRWARVETLIKGHAYPVVTNGQPTVQNMFRAHMSKEDLAEALRMHGVDDLEQVKLAYKERNGEVSVVRRQGHAD